MRNSLCTVHVIHLTLALAAAMALQGCNRVLAFSDDDAAFEYREIYLPESQTTEARELHLNHVDRDWGIWGHHLSVVLPQGHSRSVYASVRGSLCEEQFCFSAPQLYDYIVEYIANAYGEHKMQRFAILPNDNSIVCQCEQCRQLGCTETDAAPAVHALLRRLAERFPGHMFFTSHYLTTRTVPAEPFPENAGVLISAIEYPLCGAATSHEERFADLLSQWSRVTKHLYVWDYVNNFDDYFTPYPVFGIMQRRFSLYAQKGVTGIFLNGSGLDYSSFSRIKMYVLAALMQNPKTDWKALLREKCSELYPVAGEAIARFMLQQEQMVADSAKVLPLYDGVAASRQSYLPEEAFGQFFATLVTLLPKATGSEQKEIVLLCKALTMTKLELQRLNGETGDCTNLLAQLESLTADGVRIYSESFWTVESYVQDYRALAAYAKDEAPKNLLRGQRLKALTRLDEDYSDISVLTDGLIALPSNYHCGQLISSADPWLRIEVPVVKGMKHLRVGMTSNVQFHIALPTRVVLSINGVEVDMKIPVQVAGVSSRAVVDFAIPSNIPLNSIVLTIVRNKEQRTMALDEIEATL